MTRVIIAIFSATLSIILAAICEGGIIYQLKLDPTTETSRRDNPLDFMKQVARHLQNSVRASKRTSHTKKSARAVVEMITQDHSRRYANKSAEMTHICRKIGLELNMSKLDEFQRGKGYMLTDHINPLTTLWVNKHKELPLKYPSVIWTCQLNLIHATGNEGVILQIVEDGIKISQKETAYLIVSDLIVRSLLDIVVYDRVFDHLFYAESVDGYWPLPALSHKRKPISTAVTLPSCSEAPETDSDEHNKITRPPIPPILPSGGQSSDYGD